MALLIHHPSVQEPLHSGGWKRSAWAGVGAAVEGRLGLGKKSQFPPDAQLTKLNRHLWCRDDTGLSDLWRDLSRPCHAGWITGWTTGFGTTAGGRCRLWSRCWMFGVNGGTATVTMLETWLRTGRGALMRRRATVGVAVAPVAVSWLGAQGEPRWGPWSSWAAG